MSRILIAASDPQVRESLRRALADTPEFEIAGQARDSQEAVLMAHTLDPDLVLLSADMHGGTGWETAEFLMHSPHAPDVVLISSHETDLRRAMRVGARDLVPWPSSPATLVSGLRVISEQRQRRMSAAFRQAADPNRTCRIITVSGAKGGVGKTTLATNLALALLKETKEPTVLVDLYTQFGDVAMLLNLSPTRCLFDLARQENQAVDGALLNDHIEQHSSGLGVLIGSVTPVALDAVSPSFLDHIFGLLKQTYRFVVVDVPPILHPTTLHALSHASQALLIANLFDLTTLRDTRLLLETIEGSYVATERISVVLNRVCRQNRLNVQDIEKALGHSVAAQIPNDGKIVPHSINQGVPFVLSQPRSPVAQAVHGLACRLLCGPLRARS